MNVSSNPTQSAMDRGIAAQFYDGHASYMLTFTGYFHPDDHTTYQSYTLSNLRTREIELQLDQNRNIVHINTKLTPDEAEALRCDGIYVQSFMVEM